MKTLEDLNLEVARTIFAKELSDFNTAYLDKCTDGTFVVSVDEFVHKRGTMLECSDYYKKLK